MWYDDTDEQSACPDNVNFLAHELNVSDNITKFWEAVGSIPVQITFSSILHCTIYCFLVQP